MISHEPTQLRHSRSQPATSRKGKCSGVDPDMCKNRPHDCEIIRKVKYVEGDFAGVPYKDQPSTIGQTEPDHECEYEMGNCVICGEDMSGCKQTEGGGECA
jgi:hypothetical protein